MNKLILSTFGTILFLTGCSCQSSYMEKPNIIYEDDKYKSCIQLEDSIDELKFRFTMAQHRYNHVDLFAPNPICMPAVQTDAQYTKLILEDRLTYLYMLYARRGCDKQHEVKEKSISAVNNKFVDATQDKENKRNIAISVELKPEK